MLTARVGRGSKEASGGTHIAAGRCCRHKEPEHCTNNSYRQPSKCYLLTTGSFSGITV